MGSDLTLTKYKPASTAGNVKIICVALAAVGITSVIFLVIWLVNDTLIEFPISNLCPVNVIEPDVIEDDDIV